MFLIIRPCQSRYDFRRRDILDGRLPEVQREVESRRLASRKREGFLLDWREIRKIDSYRIGTGGQIRPRRERVISKSVSVNSDRDVAVLPVGSHGNSSQGLSTG